MADFLIGELVCFYGISAPGWRIMLVLTRREGDGIQIGEGITIMVVRISPTAVRIGIEAPAETIVVRRELIQEREQDPRNSAAHERTRSLPELRDEE
jgi:carbon storage regulator